MRTLGAVLIAVTVIAVAACGGGSTGSSIQNNNCTATISGAVTGSNIACTAFAGTDSNGDGNGAIGFNFTSPAGLQVTAAVKTAGVPTTKTYANTDANAQGACEVIQTSSNYFWAATAGAGSQNQGTYNLSATSIGQEISNPDGGPGNVFLSVHGSLNCTMPAFTGTGASGTATLVANF